MGASWKSTGSYVEGTGNLTPVIPTAASGDLMLCFVGTKPYDGSNSMNNSWVSLGSATDGTTGSGIDTGSMKIECFYKIHTGSETNPTVTNTTNSVSGAVIIVFQKGTNEAWETLVGTGGGDATAGTGFSVTGASALAIATNDYLVGFAAIRSDAGTQSSITITGSGLTVGSFTESPATDLATASGQDMAMSGGYVQVTAGNTSVAPVYASTLAASHTGSAYIVRVRAKRVLTANLGSFLSKSIAISPNGTGNSVTLSTSSKACYLSDKRIAVVDTNLILSTYDYNSGTGSYSIVGSNHTPATSLNFPSRLDADTIAAVSAGQTIMIYDFNGSTWSKNSLELALGVSVTICDLGDNALAVLATGSGYLRKYSYNGSAWSQVGNSFSITTSGAAFVANISSNEVMVAEVSTGQIILRHYTFNGTDWSLVGSSYTFTSSLINGLDQFGKVADKVFGLPGYLSGSPNTGQFFGIGPDRPYHLGSFSVSNSDALFSSWVTPLSYTEKLFAIVSGQGDELVGYYVYEPAFFTIATAPNTLFATQQSYVLTGNTTLFHRKMSTTVGTFSLSGIATNFIKGRKLIADVRSYTLTGNATLFKRSMVATLRTYTLTGNPTLFDRTIIAALRTYTLSGIAALFPRTYRLTADVRSYSLVGNTTLFKRTIVATLRTYTLTGNNANLVKGRVVIADVRSYTLTGNTALFKRTIIAVTQSYTLTGNNTLFKRTIIATTRAYTLTGNSALFHRTMIAALRTYLLTGNAANLLQGYKLTADVQSYVLTGNDATLTKVSAKILTADLQTYTWTRNDANLLHGFKIIADIRTYSLVGNTTNFIRHYRLTADVRAYSLNGNNTLFKRSIIATTRVYTLTGNNANLLQGYKLIADVRSYTLTGNDSNLYQGYKLIADLQTYTLTGNAINVTRHYRLTADVRSYSITGFDVNIKINRILRADTRSYSITGINVNLLRTYILTATVRSYTLTGFAAGFPYSQNLGASTGVFVLTGNDAILTYTPVGSYVLSVERGIFVLIGNTTNLKRGYLLSGQTSAFSLGGNPVNLKKGFLLTSQTGSYSLSGINTGLLKGIRMLLNTGSFQITGQNIIFRQTHIIQTELGTYILTGDDIVLTTQNSYNLTCDSGSFDLTGNDISLKRGRVFIVEKGIFEITGYAIQIPRGYLITTEKGTFVVQGSSAILGSIGMRVWYGGQFVPGKMYVYDGSTWIGTAQIYRNGQWKLI